MQKPPIGEQFALTYVDRPEVPETFADSLGRVTADGLHVRLEFVVNRLDDAATGAPKTGKMYTASRVIVTVPAMLDMINKLNALIEQMKAAGSLNLQQGPKDPSGFLN